MRREHELGRHLEEAAQAFDDLVTPFGRRTYEIFAGWGLMKLVHAQAARSRVRIRVPDQGNPPMSPRPAGGKLGGAFDTEGGTTTMFEATARLEIRDGWLEGFKQQVAEIARRTSERDEKPLRYDWFLSDDGTECEVREAYEDADALLEHQHYVGEAKMRLFRDFVDGHTMTFYGEPSLALLETMKTMGTPFKQFSLFQGLAAEAEVLEEVPA